MYKLNLCFIKRGEQILLLNRDYAPVMGLWHGVGGKIDEGETPEESVIREIYEETGIQVPGVTYKGIVSWKMTGNNDGMYVFFAVVPSDFEYDTPRKMEEGTLEWKGISWILNPNNYGIPQHVPKFLPAMLNDTNLYEHVCTFEDGKLTKYEKVPLENTVTIS